MIYQNAKRWALVCGVVASGATAAMGQVSGTEVNQQTLDEFGLDRKTGRFSWSTEEVIGIGGEGSRVSLAVTGIRNPPRSTEVWPAPFTQVNLNEPRLLSEPMPDGSSAVASALATSLFNRTVETPSGSSTFACFTICIPEYFDGASLEETSDGFRYTSRTGTVVLFREYETVVQYVDGRQLTYRSGRYWKNNFGYMLKFSGGSVQAVNLTVDYCNTETTMPCSGLSNDRTAAITSPSVGLVRIEDAAAQVTTLRWGEKTAKLYRRPLYAPPTLFIDDITERYPLGITLPGSSSEDVTIEYRPYEPSLDTHDDIVVSSITRNGVTADYAYDRYLPQGLPETEPSIGQTIEYVTGLGGPIENYGVLCEMSLEAPFAREGGPLPTEVESSACTFLDQLEAVISTLGQMAPPVGGAPGEDDINAVYTSYGYNLLEMEINQTIDGQFVNSTFAVRPAGGYANTRRRLVKETDALNRVTRFQFNQFEELSGRIAPEGNGITNLKDGFGRLVSTKVTPKNGANNLVTYYEYPSDCTDLTPIQCHSPIAMTDPNGNVTNYEYNPAGQVIKEIRPAPEVGGARPTIINEYTWRQAYIKTANGGVEEAGPEISLLTKSYTCISSSNCNANTPASDKVVTEYDYGPTTGLNNLLLRGITVRARNSQGWMETLRTCYTYNYFGERISETQPKADLPSCPA